MQSLPAAQAPSTLSQGSPALVDRHQGSHSCHMWPVGKLKRVSGLWVLSNHWASWNFKFLSVLLPIFLFQGQTGGWGGSTSRYLFIHSLVMCSPPPLFLPVLGLGDSERNPQGSALLGSLAQLMMPPPTPAPKAEIQASVSTPPSFPSGPPLLFFCSVLYFPCHIIYYLLCKNSSYRSLPSGLNEGRDLFSGVFLAPGKVPALSSYSLNTIDWISKSL